VLDFLKAVGLLLPYGEYRELRCIRNGAIEQAYYQWDELDDMRAKALRMDADGWDAYYGVLPRTRTSGKAEDCVSSTGVLWADVDAKHLNGTKISTLVALGGSSITPSIVVDSGNGVHAYWLLDNVVPFDKASEVMKGLAKAIGGDSVHDAPRVLRLPGTHNHKTDPPHEVRLLRFEPDRRVRFADFSDYLSPPKPAREAIETEPRELSALPEWLQEAMENPTPEGYRSGMIFKVMLWLIRYGYSKESISDLLAYYPDGWGEKVMDMKPRSADRWIDRTYERAAEAATTDG